MKESTPKPAPLSQLRGRIDEIDHAVLELLGRRMQVVREVAAAKRKEGRQIRDFVRERELLADRRERAEALGLAATPIESIYRQIMMASRDYQASLGAAAPAHVEAKDIVVVGGEGKMGRLLCELFRDVGHRVQSADLATASSIADAAAAAEVVVIAVPIEATLEVIAQLGPRVRRDGLLLDITSLKREPLAAMLAATEASVCGTHPMFGPGVHSLMGQRVVVCRGRGEQWHRWLVDTLQARGLVVTEASAEQHDRAMALVQVLTHFQTQVLGRALSRLGQPVEQTRHFTSPAYMLELYVAARHFAQDPALYGPIEMRNPETARITRAFREAAREISDILEARDQVAFARMFAEVRAFFGDFTAEAMEQSSYLIDRLVERGIG